MKAIKTESTNTVLLGNSENVFDLPVTGVDFEDGTVGVESCWELNKEEIEEVIKTGRVYLLCLSNTHPPIAPAVHSILDERHEAPTVEGYEKKKGAAK
jgi:hypothetical protein